jgi:fibronectin-binding autotransporter adhesin
MRRHALSLVAALALSNSAHAGFILYDTSANFVVPTSVSSVRVLAVGGGGGGANGHQGGGGSGYVNSGVFSVTAGQNIAITVGAGGSGALSQVNNNIVGLAGGGASAFGGLISVAGGGVVLGINQPAGNGGSGGGASWNGGPLGAPGGAGGSGGSDGADALYLGGTGQGDYSALLSIFIDNVFSAGAGGLGGTFANSIWNGGGGAGGILFNGIGPSAGDGSQSGSAQGGIGYGAGGGAGGYNGASIRYAGGSGASGLVYVEWDDVVSVPEPSTIALLGLGLLGFALARRKTRS